MKKIRISYNFPEWPLLRQTPGEKGIIDGYKFFLKNEEPEYDYWVVLENLGSPKETVFCNKNSTILVTFEPPSVKIYDKKYTDQYGLIITSHQNIKHPRKIITQTGLPWHIGRKQRAHHNISFSINYDELLKINEYPKEKLLSVVISDKSFTKGHKKRLKFAKALKKHFGNNLDFFGRGFNEIEDKWDAIYKYKYHLVLENFVYDDYWSEKLSDSYLGGAYPFYSGCPNLGKYFSEKAFSFIQINDTTEAISKIENGINNNLYEKSIPYLKKAKEDILTKYNLFHLIVSVIKENFKEGASGKKNNSKENISLFQEPAPSFYSKFKKKVLYS